MEKWTVAAEFPEVKIQMLLFILMGIVYAISAVIKKINTWVKNRPMPSHKDQRDASTRPPGAPSGATKQAQTPTNSNAAPPVPAQPSAPPQTIQNVLLKELQKALGGVDLNIGPVPRTAPPPTPVQKAPPPPLPEDDLQTQMNSHAVIRTTKDGRRISSTGVVIHDAATVSHTQLDHLAVLLTPQDLRRGILLHEILSPPRSKRPLRPRSA